MPEHEGFSVHTLPGGRCVSLIHKGPYEEIGRTWARVMAYVQEKGWTAALPYREVYLKGPGMIFKGNPRNYLTEIQVLVAPGPGVPRVGGGEEAIDLVPQRLTATGYNIVNLGGL
jgi:hypothetical protein